MQRGRQWLRGRVAWLVASIIFACAGSSQDRAQVTPGALDSSLLERARDEVVRVRGLVEQGALARSRLGEAEENLKDVEDEVVLTQTLYGQTHVQEMTPEQASAMVGAAERRVAREQRSFEERRGLVAVGVIAPAEIKSLEDELASRKRVLELARNREKLLEELKEMAVAEKRLEQAAALGLLKNAMIRYDGSGQFRMGDLQTISNQFERKFHRALPVSARGQTLVHQAMGLDHRNRVDIALNPEETEGLWLRHLLERLHLPYLAFRSAVVGAATAPHIHLGTGSSRLALAGR